MNDEQWAKAALAAAELDRAYAEADAYDRANRGPAYRIGAPCPTCGQPMIHEGGCRPTRDDPGYPETVGCEACQNAFEVDHSPAPGTAYRIGAPCPECNKPMTLERGYPESRMEPGLDDSVGCDDCGSSYPVLADDAPGDVDGTEAPPLEPWP